MPCYPPSNNSIQSALFLASLCNLNLNKVGNKYVVTTQDKKVSITCKTIKEVKSVMRGDARLVGYEIDSNQYEQMPARLRGVLKSNIPGWPGLFRLGTRVFGYWSGYRVYLPESECQNRNVSTSDYSAPTNILVTLNLLKEGCSCEPSTVYQKILSPLRQINCCSLVVTMYLTASMPTGMLRDNGILIAKEVRRLTGERIYPEDHKGDGAKWIFPENKIGLFSRICGSKEGV